MVYYKILKIKYSMMSIQNYKICKYLFLDLKKNISHIINRIHIQIKY